MQAGALTRRRFSSTAAANRHAQVHVPCLVAQCSGWLPEAALAPRHRAPPPRRSVNFQAGVKLPAPTAARRGVRLRSAARTLIPASASVTFAPCFPCPLSWRAHCFALRGLLGNHNRYIDGANFRFVGSTENNISCRYAWTHWEVQPAPHAGPGHSHSQAAAPAPARAQDPLPYQRHTQ